MPTDESLRRAEELWPGARRHLRESPHDFREALAAALDAAREQGEREERERWRRNVEDAAREQDRKAMQADFHGDTDGPLYHSYAARVLRSLLSAPAEVAGREEG